MIGQSPRRKEDFRLLTGNGRFSDDTNLPGQAYAFMLRSPHAHARIRGIDITAASARPGVLTVLTGREMLADGLRPIPHAVWSGHPAEVALPNTDGTVAPIAEHHAMAVGEAVHVGDIVAVVVAETVATAKDAAELVAVDYEPLAAVSHALTAASVGAPLVRGDMVSNVCIESEVGDAEATQAAFATAAHTVSLETWIQRVAGVPMEPRAAVGEYDAATGLYTLHAGAGGAVRPKADLVAVLGVGPGDVRMVMHDTGGNFGTRGATNPEFVLVVWAARRIGRPIKWTCERSEAFLCDYHARDLAASAELALDAEGRFIGMRGTNMLNIGAHAVGFSPLQKGVAIASSIYHVPAEHFRARGALTNTAPTRPYRSAGRPEVMFVMERLIDLAARVSGIERSELRRRNLVPASSMPYRNPFGMVYDSGEYHACMEAALRLGDWDGFPARQADALTRGRRRGIGVANYVDTATGVPRERAEITILSEGITEVVLGTTSQGQGHETSFAQLMTEFLGVPFESVRLVTGDTARVSVGGGAHSGRALRMGSVVMMKASGEIVDKARRIAGPLLNAAPEALLFQGGRFIVPGTDRSVGLYDVAAASNETLAAVSDEVFNTASFPYGSHVCEVEVDPETGEVEIVSYAAVDDVGRAVNPMIVHGQVHGGIVQGVGQALLEQCVYDPETGQMLSASFMDYAMPRADKFPSFKTEISEVPSPTHPLGIRPGGEGGTTPALGVVINAIVDALSEYGVTHIEMPATPERVWRAINGR